MLRFMRNAALFAGGLLLILISVGSCNLINPEEPVPTYVRVDSFAYTPNSAVPGTASHKISSVYAYYEGTQLGIFYLPATIPVITTSDSGELLLLPGIDYNALRSQQTVFPFFTAYYDTIAPAPGQTINIPAATGFSNTTITPLLEDFEGGVGFIKFAGDTGMLRTGNPGEVFEGSYSGAIYLSGGNTTAQVISTSGGSILPAHDAWLEVNYKCDMNIQLGLQGFSTAGGEIVTNYLAGLKPRADWNKVYIYLKDFVGQNQIGPYRVIVKADLESGQSSGAAYLDNLRIVTR